MQITVKSELTLAQEDINKMDNLMRIYSSAHRFAYNRIMDDDLSKNDLKKLIQETFGLNARYSYASMVDANAIIDSQKELLPMYLDDVKSKIKKSKNNLKKVKNPIKIKRLEDRIKKFEKKKKYYEWYIANHTVPRTVFGGKKNLKKLTKGKITKEEWKDIRSNQVYSIGGKIDGGNRNIRLICEEDKTKETEEKLPIRINIGNREWIYGDINVSDNSPYLPYLVEQVISQNAYSIRIMRERNRKQKHSCHSYYAYISFDVDNGSEPNGNGFAGIDVNPKEIGVTVTYLDGNFRDSKRFPCTKLAYVSSDKRDWIIGNIVRDAIEWIKGFGINTVTIEGLKFKNDLDTNKGFNRMASNFARSKMKMNLLTRCLREDMVVLTVNPAYTSIIGKIKYAMQFGINDHQSAAYVIARKGAGFDEKVPKKLRSYLSFKEKEKEKEKKSLGFWKKLWNILKAMEARGNIKYSQGSKDRIANSDFEVNSLRQRKRPKDSKEWMKYPFPTGDIVKPGPRL